MNGRFLHQVLRSVWHADPMAAVPASPRDARAPSVLLSRGRGLTRRRQLAAGLLTVVGLPLLTWIASAASSAPASESVLLVYLLVVVVVCVVGGLVPGLVAAVAAFLLANWFLTPPVRTFTVSSPSALADLVIFLLVAAIVSVTVEVGARDRARAARDRLEAQLVRRLGTAELYGVTPEQILRQVRDTYAMETVTLLEPTGQRVAVTVGPAPLRQPAISVEVGDQLRLLGYGQQPFAEDRQLLRALAEAAARVWDRQQLAAEAAKADQLAETDRVRSALLAAVSHDLRTPIASIKTAVSGLRQEELALSNEDQRQLMEAIEDGADRLAALVDDLLAMSRIQAGAVALSLDAVSLEEVLARALRGADQRLEVALPPDLPLVRADAALLERVIANLLQNSLRFSSGTDTVRIEACATPGEQSRIDLRIIDHGPGVASERRHEMFQPFQRLGDTSTGGVGLGLAIARGLTEAMQGTLTPTTTPGGGLTMTVRLPVSA